MVWLFMQRDFIFLFVYQNNEDMIHCLQKTRFSTPVQIGKDILKHGKTDTFERTYR
jgi:hypothetical protein